MQIIVWFKNNTDKWKTLLTNGGHEFSSPRDRQDVSRYKQICACARDDDEEPKAEVGKHGEDTILKITQDIFRLFNRDQKEMYSYVGIQSHPR